MLVSLLVTLAAAASPTDSDRGSALNPALRAQLVARYGPDCPALADGHTWAVERTWAFPMADGSTLVLLPCNVGAYNPSVVLTLHHPDGHWTALSVPRLVLQTRPRDAEDTVPTEVATVHTEVIAPIGITSGPQVVYPRFDPDTGILRGTSLGRGLGDMRSDAVWQWDAEGARFELLAWMTDRSDDGTFTPSCAFPVQTVGTPCPGHEIVLTEDHEAMVFEGY